MNLRICFALLGCGIFTLPGSAAPLVGVHASHGWQTTAATFRIERAGVLPAGPRAAAVGIRATSAIELFPELKGLGNDPRGYVRSAQLIQRILPPYRFDQASIDSAEALDVLFFAEQHILRARIYLHHPGKTLGAIWIEKLRKYFNFLDHDGDGYLNAYEAEFAVNNAGMAQLVQSAFGRPDPRDSGKMLTLLDVDGDERVSFDELLGYYRPTQRNLLRITNTNFGVDTTNEFMTNEMFRIFDRDQDGKLSRSELLQAEQLIAQLDQNEDECLTNLELIPNLFTRPVNPNPVPNPMPRSARPVPQTVAIYRVGDIPDNFVETLLKKYDADKNLRLTAPETPFEEGVFTKLDRNRDGELNVIELMAWRELPPDLEIDFTLGTKPEECTAKLRPGAKGSTVPAAKYVDSSTPGKAILRLGNQLFDLDCTVPANLIVRPRRIDYSFYFNLADAKKRGYFTEQDVVGPQTQFIRVLFDVMDRNGNGRVTREEFDDYFAMAGSFLDLQLYVNATVRTPSLFQLLDTNNDGRLSVPELRQSWKRLRDLEPRSGEFITKSAIQPHANIRMGTVNTVFTQPVQPNPGVPQSGGSTRGPIWFRKLDRNGDGVISRNEFPGRPADFQRLDRDNDGLITFEEAEQTDKELRPPEKK